MSAAVEPGSAEALGMSAAVEPGASVVHPCFGPLTHPPSKVLRTHGRPPLHRKRGSAEAVS